MSREPRPLFLKSLVSEVNSTTRVRERLLVGIAGVSQPSQGIVQSGGTGQALGHETGSPVAHPPGERIGLEPEGSRYPRENESTSRPAIYESPPIRLSENLILAVRCRPARRFVSRTAAG